VIEKVNNALTTAWLWSCAAVFIVGVGSVLAEHL